MNTDPRRVRSGRPPRGERLTPRGARDPGGPARPGFLVPLGLAFLLLGGCASAERGPSSGDPDRGTDAAERDRLEALYWERVTADRDRYVEADVAFMSGMIVHHAQALLMVALVPERAADPSIRTLAARIENAQRDEIALMARWLAARGEPVPRWHIEGTALVVEPEGGGAGRSGTRARPPEGDAQHDHGRLHAMPGMLSDARLEALAAATDEEFDRLFLEGMIEHHRGAIEMVRTLLATDGAAQDPDVFRLASDVQVDQRSEIARMELMLRRISREAGR